MTRVAVISGAGAVSAFGLGLPALLDGLAAGRAAVGPIRHFDVSAFPTQVAGEVPVTSIDPAWLASAADLPLPPLPDGLLRDRKVAFALLAAVEAWRAARCGPAERAATVSLALGLEQAFLEDFGADITQLYAAPQDAIRIRSRVDLGADLVGAALALTGPRVVHVSACAAGALAVAHAAALIERGDAEVVLCGGADSMVNPLGIGGMSRLGAPSPRAAADACRPFDRRRDGLAIGEGAAMFVVEAEARARARDVRPLARILGWGSTQDAYRATAPRPDGTRARAAMARALARAGLTAQAIDYINAHGTGTPAGDPAEARAIHDLAPAAPVSSIKGAVGHLMAAAGAVEIAACLLAFERDLLPGTAHHHERDPECDIDVIGPALRPARARALLTNSFGFGGQNASLVLARPA